MSPPGTEAFAIPGAMVADLVASGIGAIIKSAADRLIASHEYAVKTVLAYESGFVISSERDISFLSPQLHYAECGTKGGSDS